MPTYPTLLYTTKKHIAVGDAVYDNTGTAIPGVTIQSINQDGSFNIVTPAPSLKVYTITYDENGYPLTDGYGYSYNPIEEGHGLLIKTAEKENVVLANDFTITENTATPITFTLIPETSIGEGSGTGSITSPTYTSLTCNSSQITPGTINGTAGVDYTITITNTSGDGYASAIYINGTQVVSTTTGTATYSFTPTTNTTIGIGFEAAASEPK